VFPISAHRRRLFAEIVSISARIVRRKERTEENSIGRLAGGEGRLGERVLMVVDGDASKVVLLNRELKVRVGGESLEDANCLSSHLGSWRAPKSSK
jgi:hypothetical protein